MNTVVMDASVRGAMEIRDNWYAIRTTDNLGRLLMVGPYLPPIANGVHAVIVHAADVPALLEELRERLGVPPQIIELRGE